MMLEEFYHWHVRRRIQLLPYRIARMMPRWLVYHCAIRLIAHATTGRYGDQVVPELTAMAALERWEVAIRRDRP